MNTATGQHYYSTTSDQPAGFVQEAIVGYLRTAADSATVSLYRHFSAATGDYVLTTSSAPPTGYALETTLGYLYTTPSYDSGDHQDLAYHYDQVGNVSAVVDNIFTGSRIYTYDALHRLETAYGDFGPNQTDKFCTYNYNSIGNILNKCGVTFTYGDPMHPSAVTSISSGKTYTYNDANGNMTSGGGRDFTWNIDNRVTSVTLGGSVTSMEYDYTGARVKKVGAGGETLYPFAGYEIAPNGEVTKFIRIGTENFASKRGTTKLFYHNDHLGGVNVITDSSGARCQLNEYDPWGGVSRSEGATPGTPATCDPTHRFTGQELDAETGLYYYGGRYYDPEISRFISADPFVPRPGNPQTLNRYSYTLNNPVRYIDPSGYFYMSKSSSNGPFGGGIFGMIMGVLATVMTQGAGAPLILAGAIGGFTAAAFNVAGTSGVNPAAALFGSALVGGITAGGLGGGIVGGFGFPIGGPATTVLGVLAADITNASIRGLVVGTVASLASGKKFSDAFQAGLLSAGIHAAGVAINAAIGHAVGYIRSGGNSPTVITSNGQSSVYYEAPDKQLGSFGNVVSGDKGQLESRASIGPGKFADYLNLTHEVFHGAQSGVLGLGYAILHGISQVVSSGLCGDDHSCNIFERTLHPYPSY